MPVPVAHGQPQQQSVLQKMGMGAAMGGAVGMTLGFLFGGFAIISRGAGPRGPLNTLATYMTSSGGTFAFFMHVISLSTSFIVAWYCGSCKSLIDEHSFIYRSIGSVIRTETQSSFKSTELSSLHSQWRSRHIMYPSQSISNPSLSSSQNAI